VQYKHQQICNWRRAPAYIVGSLNKTTGKKIWRVGKREKKRFRLLVMYKQQLQSCRTNNNKKEEKEKPFEINKEVSPRSRWRIDMKLSSSLAFIASIQYISVEPLASRSAD
jgi:hypothetical protein